MKKIIGVALCLVFFCAGADYVRGCCDGPLAGMARRMEARHARRLARHSRHGESRAALGGCHGTQQPVAGCAGGRSTLVVAPCADCVVPSIPAVASPCANGVCPVK